MLSLDLLEKEKYNKSLIMNQATMVRRLKQPLFSMMDHCDTLLQTTTDRQMIKTLSLLSTETNLLLCLVADILDIAGIVEGSFEPMLQIFDPVQTFEWILAMFDKHASTQLTELIFIPTGSTNAAVQRTDIKQLKHSVKKQKEEHRLPRSLVGDETRLKQVLVNIIRNALQFSRCKPVHLFTKYDEVEQLLCVRVEDKGKGISSHELKKIIDRLSVQCGHSLDANEGNGLLISKSIVDQLNGQLHIFSAGLNEGTTIEFTMRMEVDSEIGDDAVNRQKLLPALTTVEEDTHLFINGSEQHDFARKIQSKLPYGDDSLQKSLNRKRDSKNPHARNKGANKPQFGTNGDYQDDSSSPNGRDSDRESEKSDQSIDFADLVLKRKTQLEKQKVMPQKKNSTKMIKR